MQDLSDIKRLQLFRQVVECGGLTPAETILDINLPTISAHLSALERSLGMRLCDRGRQGFRLTPEGERVLDASKRLFESMDSFRSEIGAISERISGVLRVGVVDNTVSDPGCPVIPALRALRDQGRDLELHIDVRNPSELERAVLDERLDLAIGPFRSSNPGIDQEALHQERISLFIGAGHPLFGKDRVALEDLAGADYVMRGYLRESQRGTRDVSFNPSAIAHSVEGVAALVLTGRYVGYMPDHYAAPWVAGGRMRALLPDTFSHALDFTVISLKGRRRSRAAQAMIDALIQANGRAVPGVA